MAEAKGEDRVLKFETDDSENIAAKASDIPGPLSYLAFKAYVVLERIDPYRTSVKTYPFFSSYICFPLLYIFLKFEHFTHFKVHFWM